MRIATLIFTPLLLASSALSTPTSQHDHNGIHDPRELNIREIFSDFVHIFYDQRNYSLALNKYLAPDLIQHNPTLANGRDAEIAAVLSITKGYIPSVQIFMVDKNGIGPAARSSNGSGASPDTAGFGMTYTRWTGEPGTGLPLTAVVDVYRIDHRGLLVEHWDAIEPLPANTTNPDPF
jgi:predicted SnoaL-like aldol condensation-catalyzing enzyme